MKKFSIYFLLFLSIGLFLYFELIPSLKIPEVRWDEAMFGSLALKLVNNLHTSYCFDFFGRHFLLAGSIQHGALECYILAPFLLLGGASAEALRIGPMVFGAAEIILTYWFARRLFNPYVGALSAILLAINSFYIITVKQSCVFGFSQPFFSLLSLSLLLKYIDTRKNLYFYLAMFALGFGFNVRGYFIYFILALFLAGYLFYRRIIRPKIRCIGFISFIIGASPVIYHYFRANLFHNFLFKNILVTDNKINNLNFIQNMLTRASHLNEVLAGDYSSNLWFRNFPIFVFWGCAGVLLYKILFEKASKLKRKIGFMLVLNALIVIISSYTFTRHYSGHFITLFPYIQILISIAIWIIFSTNNIGKIIASLLAVSLISYYLSNCFFMVKQLKGEEVDNKNCNVYVITQWLLDNKYYNIASFDPGSGEGINFISGLNINFVEFNNAWYYANEDAVSFAINNTRPDAIFILKIDSSPDVEKMNNYFYTYAKSLNKEAITLKNFCKSNGNIKYTACQLRQRVN